MISRRTLLILAAAIACPRPASATDWNDTAGGTWSTPANWSSGVPTSSDDATFDLSFLSGYAVSATAAATASDLNLYDDNVTLNVTGGNTLAVGSDLNVGGTSGGAVGPGTLTIDGAGSVSVAGTLNIWNNGSTLNLSGGSLSVGSLDAAGIFNWTGGTLNLTGSVVSIGPGGTLGNDSNPVSPFYNIVQIGLTDAAHTETNGYSSNSMGYMNAVGQVVGVAARYSGNTSEGQDAWLYSPSMNSTQLIGLIDPAHTQTGGYSSNTPKILNSLGDVVGVANIYSGSTQEGQDTWFYSPTTNTTQIIGLTGSAYASPSGAPTNTAYDMNNNGDVVGFAEDYSGSTDEGRDTWLFSPTTDTTEIIGLNDSTHTKTGGYSYNAPLGLNLYNGEIVGYAYRYSGTTQIGQDAWLYSSSTNTTQEIGLTDAAHSKTNGTSYNIANEINLAGQVGGFAYRYSSTGMQEGQDAWIYTPSTNTTQVVGLTDAAHVTTSGYSSNSISYLGSTGIIAGTAQRASGNNNLGYDAWVYNPSTNTTQVIGLTDAAHTDTLGYYDNSPSGTNAAGQVIGQAARYTGNMAEGEDAWLYSPATNTTKLIGLTGSLYTQSSGYAMNVPLYLTAAGQVVGFSNRYINDGQEGMDWWFYDPTNQTTFDIVSSPSASGYNYAQVNYVSPNGTVFGYYDVNGGPTQDVYEWSETGGLHDLGSLVQGGLTAAGWASLASVNGYDGTPDLAGQGSLLGSDGSQGAYELTPVSGLVINPGMNLNTASALTVLAGGSLTLSGGSITTPGVIIQNGGVFNWSTGTLSSTSPITVNAGGTLNLKANTATGILVRTLNAIIISPNSGANPNGQVNVLSAPSHANRQLIVTTGLSIAGTPGAWQGQIDLANNDMIVKSADESGLGTVSTGGIENQIATGRGSTGSWTGNGITSSSAAANPALMALGVVVNDTNNSGTGSLTGATIIPGNMFDGQSVSDGDVIIKYTFVGDANLDGTINAADYLQIDNGFQNNLTGWYNGDFNYDGVINGDDYTLIDNAFNSQGTVSYSAVGTDGGPTEMIASDTAQVATSVSVVPEPSALTLGFVAAIGLMRRRRRLPPLQPV